MKFQNPLALDEDEDGGDMETNVADSPRAVDRRPSFEQETLSEAVDPTAMKPAVLVESFESTADVKPKVRDPGPCPPL